MTLSAFKMVEIEMLNSRRVLKVEPERRCCDLEGNLMKIGDAKEGTTVFLVHDDDTPEDVAKILRKE